MEISGFKAISSCGSVFSPDVYLSDILFPFVMLCDKRTKLVDKNTTIYIYTYFIPVPENVFPTTICLGAIHPTPRKALFVGWFVTFFTPSNANAHT